MRNRLFLLLAAVVVLLGASRAADTKPAGTLTFHTRAQVETTAGSGDWRTVEKTAEWAPKKTAIIICDMWDRHWCEGATKRVAEIAPRMNEVIKEARRRGVLIIHAPSSTMKFYAAHAERLKAIQAPKATPPADVSQWKSLNTAKEGPLPIDDSDGGCNDEPQCKQGSPWQRQIATLEIQPEDYISDDGAEVYNILAKHGIDNVILLGVHTNMCVLGRPFSIRQMVSLGKNVLLMRDMTDTMYNSRRKPYVSHFAGTDLVVEHIEKYWCASITSADLLGGEPFHFKEDRRKNVCVIIAENEYHTWETLPEFAEKDLARRGFNVSYVMSSPSVGDTVFTNYAAIKEADVLILSARRRTPPKEMIALIREHLSAGKALVGIRTASHAFGAKAKDEQHEGWETFDIDVLGANYLNHYGKGPDTIIRPLPEAVTHPVLTGIPAEGFKSTASLYKYKRTAGTVTPLLTGQMEGRPEVEMLAWAYTGDNRRVFYTSLGAPEDFKNPIFRRLLLNGVLWALNEKVPPAGKDYSAKWELLPVPGTWEDNTKGALNYDGFAWYRCVVKLPATWKGKAAELFVERVDNAHSAYVNGVKVGGAGALPPIYQNGDSAASKYPLPAEILRPGENNLIAIRVYDEGGRGGFKGAPPALLQGNEAIKLEGEWEFRTGDNQAWATPEKDLAQARPHFASVADASAVAGRVFAHATQEAPFTPAESLKMFKVPDDLEIEQVLAEPQIAQPLFLNFDERGRMWVVEYRQYPFPAGLKMLSRDNVWRAVYDKVPPAPPHHFRGADKITIHEDTKGNGVFDKHTTFVEGLNIATSVTRGRGGVWVMNPPYLLFYADKNNDDVPDGDPVVHLAGFGLEDTHSVANSLRWGPDGWLYGCQGSTVTASITRPGLDKEPIAHTMGQQIWRYHPETRRFEVFSEGGGNAFGLELDAKARIFSGHNGGNTRGFHYMQGAYLQKGFEKHGQLSNPYAFGYFPQMAHPDVERFTHNFIIYEGAALPVSYRGNLFGVEPLQGRVVQSEIQRVGATFKTRDLGYVTTSGDAWFKPVDIKAGPDGAIYICDWYDRQVNHYRNHEGQIDRGNGRIYRLKAKGAKPGAPFNLATKTGPELVALLKHENKWFRQEAQRLLADRKDQSLAPALLKQIQEGKGQAALEALWAHYVTAGLSDDVAMIALGHEDQYVRAWATRLLGDEQKISPSIAARLTALAATEPDIETRAQLACTAKRLPAADSLPLVRNLLRRDEDAVDSRQPLLLWWAIEAKAESNRAEVLALLEDKSLWPHPLVKTYLLERLMRRYAAAGTRQDLLTCAKLLQLSPDAGSSMLLLAGFENAFKGRSVAGLPDELTVALAKASDNPTVLGLRRGDDQAVTDALRLIADTAGDKKLRLQYVQILGEVHQAKGVDALLGLLGDASQTNLHKAALTSLQSFAEPRIGAEVVKQFGRLTPDTRAAAFTLLASRPAWAEQLLAAVAGGKIAKDSVPQDARRKIKTYSSPAITALAAKCWGAERVPTTDEMRQRITHLTGALRDGSGSPYEGQKLFNTACATCHRLFSTGGQIGPDLTAFKRDDLDTMLLSIINPSAEIREGFENYTVATKDGRTLSGFLADKDQRVVVLRGIDGENVTIPQEQIQEMKSAGISLMPEGLLDGMDDQQIRHLFAYLRSTQPLVR